MMLILGPFCLAPCGAAAAQVHQPRVETRIGRALLSGDILDGAVIRIRYADGELTVGYENPPYENAA